MATSGSVETNGPQNRLEEPFVSDEPEEEVLRLDLPKKGKAPAHSPGPPPGLAPKKLETLEDLYHYYPDIGDGQFRLRVTRLAPKSFGGYPIAGHLGDLDERLSIEEFRGRFGGGTYGVCVMGPAYGRKTDDGSYPIKQLTSDIEIRIPGAPAQGSLPSGSEEFGMTQGMMGMRPSGFMEPPQVSIKRMELDDKERERQRAIIEKGSSTPEHIVRALTEQSNTSLMQVRELAESKNQVLREQNAALIAAVQDKDKETKSLRDEILKVRSDASNAVREAEAALEKRITEHHNKSFDALKEVHNKESNALREAWNKEVKEVESRYRERLDDSNRKYNDEIVRRENDSRNERERLVRDATAERERIVREAERSEKSLKETYEARIADLRHTTDRELKSIKEQKDTAVESLRAQYEQTSRFAQESANMRIETNKAEIDRLRNESESLRRENEKLLKASVKDPITFLTETRTVATELLGMVSADEVKAAAEESGEFDWKKEGAKALFNIVQKLPETAKGVAESVAQVRAQNQHNAEVAQQMAQQQQQRPQQRGQAQGGNRRRMAPPPQTWQGTGTPPPYTGPVMGAEIPFSHPYTPMPYHTQMQQQQQQLPPPPQQPQEFGFTQQAPQQAPQQQQAAQQPQMPQRQQQSSPPPPEPQPQVTESGIEIFISEVDKAIQSDVITPKMFADGFVGQIGHEQAAHWMNQLTADQFIEHIEQTGQGGAIATFKGRKYVNELWTEVKKIIGSK